MKKFIFSLMFCFAVSNAFAALTAQEVLSKLDDNELLGNMGAFPAYEVEYETRNSADNSIVILKETVSGANMRMDCKAIDGRSGETVYVSLIGNKDAVYISNRRAFSEEAIVFTDYKVVKDTGSLSSYSQNSSNSKGYMNDYLDISFDPDQAKDSNKYIIDLSVKDPEKLNEEFQNKQKNGEEMSVEEFIAVLLSNFESKIFIDKGSLLTDSVKIKHSERSIYKNVEASREYKDKSEEEKRGIVKQMQNKAYAEITYSGYKKAAGTNFFYPSETRMKSPMFADIYPDGVSCVIKTNYFKVLKEGETDPAVFVPANIKKGKGKLAKEFTQTASIYDEMNKQFRKELLKTIKESLVETAKETAKEEGKKVVKEGVKSIFKGISGF